MVGRIPPSVGFRPATVEDAGFILGIRNDWTTRSRLHDSRAFLEEDFQNWFDTVRPGWLLIIDESCGESVGYVRTKWLDEARSELQIGIDIDPAKRRQGFARAAYHRLFTQLRRKMIKSVSLEVLDTNVEAFALYQELGFVETGRRPYDNGSGATASISMNKELQDVSGRQCKVIASWFGDRRHFWAGRHGPQTAFEMYSYLLNREFEVDQGVASDTVFVINMPLTGDLSQDLWFQRLYRLVCGQNGARTPSGFIRVLERPNIGISFGAFDHAFHELESEYDFWHFLEDDHIVVKGGCLGVDCRHFKELGQDIGFIASVGCSGYPAPHCHGGCGVSSREVLRDTKVQNYSNDLGRHHLPYWYNIEEGAGGHELNGEVRFTHEIWKLGLDLIDSRNEKFLVNWFGSELRNCHGEAARLVEWTDEMAAESVAVGCRPTL